MTSTVTKLNAAKFWMGILLNSSRSPLKECVAMVSSFFQLFSSGCEERPQHKGPRRTDISWTQFKDYNSSKTQLFPTNGLSRL